jgi:starch synthase
VDTLHRAIGVYRDNPAAWRAMQRAGMATDFSWSASAHGYEQIYGWAMGRGR